MKRSVWALAGMVMIFSASSTVAREIRIPDDYPTIQEGLDRAEPGDVVQVAAGEYAENVVITTSEIALQGGFNPETWERSPAEFPSYIDGNGDWNAVLVEGAHSVEVSGFDISHAKQLLKCAGSHEIRFLENVLHDSVRQYNGYTHALVVADESSNVVMSRNQVYDIVSAYNSEGVWITNSDDVFVMNNTLHNVGRDGVFARYCSGISVRNNIFSDIGESGIQMVASSDASGAYNCFYGVRLRYEGIAPGPGDIAANPSFVNAGEKDFHLREDSPCIDAGDPDMKDPDSTRLDMGALYFDQGMPAVQVEFVPESDVAYVGESFGVDALIVNGSDEPLAADSWVDLYLPTGELYASRPFHDPWRIMLEPGFAFEEHFDFDVPGDTPLGGYYSAVLRVGTFPDDVIAESGFEFVVSLNGRPEF